MKIFSLETKTNLVGWSVILGFLFNAIILMLPIWGKSPGGLSEYIEIIGGWPVYLRIPFDFINGSYFQATLTNVGYLCDLFFWILVAFIILSLVRHFRKKNVQITSKQN